MGHVWGSQNQSLDDGITTDYSQQLQTQTGVQDGKLISIPLKHYGTPQLLLQAIEKFKPDAIFHFTDPRFWYWMYEIDRLIRTKIPIIYYNIWDNLPYPRYNQKYYSCSDLIMCISKQTYNIVKNVCDHNKRQDWQTKYVPHGINQELYWKVGKNNAAYSNFRKNTNADNYDFTMLFVSKNMPRKNPALIMEAWHYFMSQLSEKQRQKCRMVFRCDPNDQVGMPLEIFNRDVLLNAKNNFQFISGNVSPQDMNFVYNSADVIINASTAQGFGLSTAEGLACGVPFIGPVIGGQQDQMRFEDETGKWIDFQPDFPTNAHGKYTKHGKWAIPLYTTGLQFIGSAPTPYIYDMHHTTINIVNAIKYAYQNRDKLSEWGEQGKNWLLGEQSRMSAKYLSQDMITHIDKLFQQFKPYKKYNIFKAETIELLKYSGTYNPLKKTWN